MRTNALGVAMIDSGPGLMMCRAIFGPGKTIDSPPRQRDLQVPSTEAPALDYVARQLKLDGMSDRRKIQAIRQYFARDFTYSLNPPRRRLNPQQPWLSYFLLTSHCGHCEYFATATVLLLREAGIPARYVTGYGIPENARHGEHLPDP